MADAKPKDGGKTENNDHSNLKVAVRMVLWWHLRDTPLSKLRKAHLGMTGFTPAQLETEDKGTIDVFQWQPGGVF
ncbi:small ubiquitin-related modifier 2-like [Acomys russatus]|uniref:small ubiquitin-related modifier 2-like n=1 Tax=Acomys russatus TaxID=60746 RepID=UPI0021E33967|nr:small ubiquitin-related modifier 2-like [Acomys russatus]